MYFRVLINLFILLSVMDVGKTFNDSECDRNIDTVEKKFIEDFFKVSAYKNNNTVKCYNALLLFYFIFQFIHIN